MELPAASPDAPELYMLVEEQNWSMVMQRASSHPEEADYIDPNSKCCALHAAVIGRETSNPGGRMSAIGALLMANPDSGVLTNEENGFTPLHYACLIEDDSPNSLEEEHAVVRLLLEHCAKAANVLSREGYAPLDVHIIAMSRLKRRGDMGTFRRAKKSQKAAAATAIMKALLDEDLNGGLARPLDLLFECNSLAVLEQVALEEAQASSSKLRARRQARSTGGSVASAYSSGSTNFTNFWVWEWALILLKSEHNRKFRHYKPIPPFNVMHTAAQVKDCPLPFLMLSMRAFPNQVRAPDAFTGNLPLHTVAGWETSDPSSISRKSMALSALVSEYPQATKVRNKSGKTPLSLALETGTSWDNGVRRLTTFQRDGSFGREPSFAHR